MGSVNKVIIVGHLGADPDFRHTQSNRAVCNMSVATSETWKDRDGQKQEKTEWHRITVWGDMGENCAKYLAKGRLVYVEGRLQTSSYDKDGQKHYSTTVVAERVVFLGSSKDGGEGRSGGQRSSGGGRSGGRDDSDDRGPPSDDDIPF